MSMASIISRVNFELASKGFTRKKATWNRERDLLVDVINIQTSKSGDTVTLNAGVLSHPVYSACWGHGAESFIEEPFCTVRVRMGQLLDKKDHWWPATGTRSADEITECIHAYVLPFFEKIGSLEGMRNWLASTGIPSPKNPLGSICFAVIQSQLYDTDGACKTLAMLEDRALGAWKVRAQEVAERIGCPFHRDSGTGHE